MNDIFNHFGMDIVDDLKKNKEATFDNYNNNAFMKIYSFLYDSTIKIFVPRGKKLEKIGEFDHRKDKSKDPMKEIRLVKYDEHNEYYDLMIDNAVEYIRKLKKHRDQGFFYKLEKNYENYKRKNE